MGKKTFPVNNKKRKIIMTIGERLREERERLKLTQPVFAEAGGTTKQTQHAYESNRTTPKGSYLAKVAMLGVDVGYVISGERFENVAGSPIELAYLRQCRALATKGLAQQGLDGLNFLRISNGIEWPEQKLEPAIEG
ncbi:hypothetical protein PL263_05100 [Methylomonas sp. EFPC3]|uniref:hypothetical protein n=1 Tax=Methylomonas sp. EFPC3 TaxID=3021710 RepID=UPI002416B2DE|nr:hypothetical protein [Methylomonas sp. EFPC3]WFP51407.1 hypothetical protein PL263_05100 [Methylomonas sp. EFPC3]